MQRLAFTPFNPITQNPGDNSRTSPLDLFLQLRAKWQQRLEIPALISGRNRLQVVWLQQIPFHLHKPFERGAAIRSRQRADIMSIVVLQGFQTTQHR